MNLEPPLAYTTERDKLFGNVVDILVAGKGKGVFLPNFILFQIRGTAWNDIIIFVQKTSDRLFVFGIR